MPYDQEINDRIRTLTASWKHTDSKNMFGGVCHLLKGNMYSGVYKEFLILRLGQEGAEKALEKPHIKPFDITGRPMKGWVMVDKAGLKSDETLKAWLDKAKAFAQSIPPKQGR